MAEYLIKGMARKQGVTEQLKAEDMMKWVGLMNNIRACADEIVLNDTIEYRKDLDVGVRTNGFGSARLLMGIFQNDEFGSYTLYAYTGAKEFVVLTSGTKTLVIGMNDVEDTQAIYDTMLEKIGE